MAVSAKLYRVLYVLGNTPDCPVDELSREIKRQFGSSYISVSDLMDIISRLENLGWIQASKDRVRYSVTSGGDNVAHLFYPDGVAGESFTKDWALIAVRKATKMHPHFSVSNLSFHTGMSETLIRRTLKTLRERPLSQDEPASQYDTGSDVTSTMWDHDERNVETRAWTVVARALGMPEDTDPVELSEAVVARLDRPENPATKALDEIARICGCPDWDYPGQVVRDVAVLHEKTKAGSTTFEVFKMLHNNGQRKGPLYEAAMAELGLKP